MEMTTRMELRPVSELIPYARNAREHSEVQIRQLRSSLREFGFVAPLLIDAQGNILAGHGRLAAAAAEGLERVPCVLVEHLTATQRRAYILADNRLAEQASWDAELVSLELQELRDAGFELDLTGFDASDILLEDPPEAGEAGYVPELPAVHPTMKPVKLFAYLVANSTLPGAAVLDLFAGSGTTAIACEQLGRTAYLMELDPRFADVIIDRWEKACGEKAVLLHAP